MNSRNDCIDAIAGSLFIGNKKVGTIKDMKIKSPIETIGIVKEVTFFLNQLYVVEKLSKKYTHLIIHINFENKIIKTWFETLVKTKIFSTHSGRYFLYGLELNFSPFIKEDNIILSHYEKGADSAKIIKIDIWKDNSNPHILIHDEYGQTFDGELKGISTNRDFIDFNSDSGYRSFIPAMKKTTLNFITYRSYIPSHFSIRFKFEFAITYTNLKIKGNAIVTEMVQSANYDYSIQVEFEAEAVGEVTTEIIGSIY